MTDFDPNYIKARYTFEKSELADIVSKIQDKSATAADLARGEALAKEYYTYLDNVGVQYAQIALEVISNDGAFGQLANAHLQKHAERVFQDSQKVDYTIKSIRVELAYSDAKLRSQTTPDATGFAVGKDGFVPYDKVAGYHYDTNKNHDLPKQAWGGLFFEEFMGSGAYMDIGGQDTKVEVCQSCAFKALVRNEQKEGIAAREALKDILDTIHTQPNAYGAATQVGWNRMVAVPLKEAQQSYQQYIKAHPAMANEAPFDVNDILQGKNKKEQKKDHHSHSEFQGPPMPPPSSGGTGSGTGTGTGGGGTGASGGWNFGWKPSIGNWFGYDTPSPVAHDYQWVRSSYMPAYGSYLYTMHRPASLYNNHMKDPLWLYDSRPKVDEYKISWLIENAKREVRQEILLSKKSFFRIDPEAIARRVYNKYASEIQEATMGYADTHFGTGGSSTTGYFASLVNSFTPGTWNYELRNAVEYAASHVSPLVLDLNGDGVKLFPYSKGVYFDIDNDGFAEKIGWLSPEDGHLAQDLNGNGIIDDITELFGDDLVSAFLKLSLLDTNDDHIIDKQDEAFGELLVWRDKNSNGFSEPEELKTLPEMGIASISLVTEPAAELIEGNTITETAEFTFADGRKGVIADVHYHNDDMDAWKLYSKSSTAVSGKKYVIPVSNFSKGALKALYEKLMHPDSLDVNYDWVAETIKDETLAYLDRYQDNKEQAYEQFVSSKTRQFTQKHREHQNSCQQKFSKATADTFQKHVSDSKEAEATMLHQVNAQFKQAQEVLYSRLLQEENAQRTEIIKAANAASSAENKRLHKQLSLHGQARYDAAVQVAHKRISDEAEAKIVALKTTYEEKYKTEYASLEKKFISQNDELFKAYEDKKKEEIIAQSEDHRTHKQKCEQENYKIAILYRDQLSKAEAANKAGIAAITSKIKEAANTIYEFFRAELAQEESPVSAAQLYENYKEFLHTLAQEDHSTAQGGQGVDIDPVTLLLPNMRGYGKMPALHIAMTENPALKAKLLEFLKIELRDLSKVHGQVVDILYEWAGISKIQENARTSLTGINIEARKVAFIEAFTGQDFKQLGASKSVGQHASTSIQKAWDIALASATKALLVQGPFVGNFPRAQYNFAQDKMYLNATLESVFESIAKLTKDHTLTYDFWVMLGYILAQSADELNVTINQIQTGLSQLAGQPILVDAGIFQLVGDNGNNEIYGTSGSDYIKGLGGKDKLHGKEGSDFIEGGDGNDEIDGGDGIDRLFGDAGKDIIHGGKDKDFIYGGEGNDELYGDEGDDDIEGGPGADKIDGGEGSNTLSYAKSPVGVHVNLATHEARDGDAEGDTFSNITHLGGSEFDDVFYGDDQDNAINGEGGNDTLYGGKGDDHLFGATGEDHLYGEDGNDILVAFEGADHMDGGEGSDTVSYAHPYATVGVKVSLRLGMGSFGYAQGDTYVNIENVHGSKHDDVIEGDEKNNIIYGHEGDDQIDSGDGDDTIVPGPGHNIIVAGEGNDQVLLGLGMNDIAIGGNGTDTISYAFSPIGVDIDLSRGTAKINVVFVDTIKEFENAMGSPHDDKIYGDDQSNVLAGLAGNDVIFGGKGDDRILGGEGIDIHDGGEGSDTIDYSQEPEAAITINLATGAVSGGVYAKGDQNCNIENVLATKFDDDITGDDQSNRLYGLDGDDVIRGGKGNDLLVGGKGTNQLYGEEDNDVFIIGEGENKVYGGQGQNTVSYVDAKQPVNIDLAINFGQKASGELDTYEDISHATGSPYADTIKGDVYSNTLDGHDGDDEIDGEEGNDIITGGKGNNKLRGGAGNDEFRVLEGNNIIDGGEGKDTISYAALREGDYQLYEKARQFMSNPHTLPAQAGVNFTLPAQENTSGLTISLASKKVKKSNDERDRFENIENVIGTHYDDTITGDDQDNVLNGLNGNDIIRGGKGNDSISSGRGHSKLYGEEGDDNFHLSKGTADIDGGEGFNTLSLRYSRSAVKVDLEKGQITYLAEEKVGNIANIQALQTTDLNDEINDDDGDCHFDTGKGDDSIHLRAGDDIVSCGEGKDTVYFYGHGKKLVSGGYDRDTYVFTDTFLTEGKNEVIIVDFAIQADYDKLDLSQLAIAKSMKDLTMEAAMVMDSPATIIKLAPEKNITLLHVSPEQLEESHFIFTVPEQAAPSWFSMAA